MPITKRIFDSIVLEEINSALKDRKDSRRFTNGPIWAWLQCANNAARPDQSKIELLQTGNVKWQWKGWNAAGLIIVDRLSKQHGISWMQKNMLSNFIQHRYPGSILRDYTVTNQFRFNESSKQWAILCQKKTEDFVTERIEKFCHVHNAPLRLILSPSLTVAIHLKFMEYYK